MRGDSSSILRPTGVLLCLASAFLWPPLARGSQDVSYCESKGLVAYGGRLFVYYSQNDSPESIYARGVGTENARVVLTNDTWVFNPTVSPTGTHIAFCEKRPELAAPRLRVITLEGHEVNALENVQDFAWSPKGGAIACILGTDSEPCFLSAGTWIWDVASGDVERIHDGGYRVAWPVFDGNVYVAQYVDGGAITRYDTKTQTLEATPYHGLCFSSDGKYYFFPASEGGPFRLYLRETNEDVTAQWPLLAARSKTMGADWLDAHTLAVQGNGSRDRRDYIFDLDRNTLRMASGVVAAYAPDRRSAFVIRPGGLVEEPLSKMERLPPEAWGLAPPPSVPFSGPFTYRFLGDVALDEKPQKLSLSGSGRHLNLGYSRVARRGLVVYTDLERHTLYARTLPKAYGYWDMDDVLSMRFVEPKLPRVALPPYDDVVRLKERIAEAPEQARIRDRLTVSAWEYCEDEDRTTIPAVEPLVLNSLKELSAATQQYFLDVPPRMPIGGVRFPKATISQVAKADEVYMVDEAGERVYPTSVGHRGGYTKIRLFMVMGSEKVEVTGPDDHSVRAFSVDPLKKRVCVQALKSIYVFDALTGERHYPHPEDMITPLRMEYHCVPGEDLLLVEMRSPTEYVKPWLELRTLDGESLGSIPTGLEDGSLPSGIGRIALSRDILAIVLDGKVLRVLQAVRAP